MNGVANERYLFSGLTLDLDSGRLFSGGEEIALRPKSFALLAYMVRNAGRVISKDELMSELWPDVTVTEDSLTQCISDVRRALGSQGAGTLRTVPRRGYLLDTPIAAAVGRPVTTPDARADRLVPTFAELRPEPTSTVAAGEYTGVSSGGMARVSTKGPGGSPIPEVGAIRKRRMVLAVAIAAVILAVAAGLWALRWPGTPLRAAPLTMAIVRFTNQTGDPEKDYLRDAIPNNAANILGASDLFRFTEYWFTRNAAEPGGVAGIAADLGVDLVLDGSIGSASPGFSFTGQLYDGPTGKLIKTLSAEVPDGDLPRLQYLVAHALADEAAALTGATKAAALDPAWGSSVAGPDEYAFFLRAQTMFLASDFSGKDDAKRLIDAGLARYPRSVPLRMLKAEILANQSMFGTRTESWANAQAGWAILSDMPDPATLPPLERWHLHSVRALATRLATGDFEAGMRDAVAAVALVPHAMTRNVELATVAAEAGHGAEAIDWVRGTMRKDPAPKEWQRDVLAWALIVDGRPEEALAEYAVIQRYCLPCKVVALVRTGRMEEARNLVGTIRRERPWITIAHESTWPTGKLPFMPERILSPYLRNLRKAGLPETGPPAQ
jgi:DNA-binding winged helix-turn-helix (wHTH) protein/TolB-like protein